MVPSRTYHLVFKVTQSQSQYSHKQAISTRNVRSSKLNIDFVLLRLEIVTVVEKRCPSRLQIHYTVIKKSLFIFK